MIWEGNFRQPQSDTDPHRQHRPKYRHRHLPLLGRRVAEAIKCLRYRLRRGDKNMEPSVGAKHQGLHRLPHHRCSRADRHRHRLNRHRALHRHLPVRQQRLDRDIRLHLQAALHRGHRMCLTKTLL